MGRLHVAEGNLMGIVRARTLSHATMRNIPENLFLSVAYNVDGIPLAAGLLFPFSACSSRRWVAAAAMALSSIGVIGNALAACAASRWTCRSTQPPPYTLEAMDLRHPLRRCATLLMVVSLLFSQLALANYICPGMANAEQMSAMMASGTPCEGMDASAPVLCHQHAADATQSFEMAKVAAPTLPVVVHVLVLPLLLDSAEAVSLPFSERPEARPPPDPVFLKTLRLRV